MDSLTNAALWIAEGRSANPGSGGKILIIVGVILGLVVLAVVGSMVIQRFGHTKSRSLDSHVHPPGEGGRAGNERKP